MHDEPMVEAQLSCNEFASCITNQLDQLDLDLEEWKNGDRTDTTLYKRLQKTIEHLSGTVEIYEQDCAELEYLESIHAGELLN